MKAAPQQLQLITFDVFGTLVVPRRSIGAVYADCLPGEFLAKEKLAKEIDARFPSAWQRAKAELGEPVSETVAKKFWERAVGLTLGGICPEEEIPAAFAAAWTAFGCGENWRVLPGVRAALQALRFLDYRLAALTNADARMRTVLETLQLAPFFEAVFTSTELGAAKPSAAVFKKVAKEMAVAPVDWLHVGDSLEDDVNGALAAGCRAAWLAPQAHFKPVGAWVVADLPALVERVRGAATTHLQRKPNRRAVRNLVADLRGLPDEGSWPKGRRHEDPERAIGELMITVAKEIRAEARPVDALRAAWPQLFGTLAEECEPTRIDAGGALVVRCANPVVRQELQFRVRQVLQAVQKIPACATVRRVVFQL